MKIKHITHLGILAATIAFASCENKKRQDNLAPDLDSVSYALGLDMATKIAENFKTPTTSLLFKDTKMLQILQM